MNREAYITFYEGLMGADRSHLQLERLYHAVGQLLLKLINLNKLIVHVDSGLEYENQLLRRVTRRCTSSEQSGS